MIRSKIAPRVKRVKTMTFLWGLLGLVLHVWPRAVAPAHAQGSRKDDIVFNSRGIPLAGATVRVCAMPASGQPCTPLALIYSDAALTQALANPTTTDGLGNYFFYAAPGKYEIEISGPAITTKQIPNVVLPNDPSSPNFSAVSAFSLTLSGNLTVNGSTTVVGNLASGTLNLANQSTPPGAASSGTVNMYTKTADKRLYYKDDTGTEVGPLGAGAQTSSVNTFTASQNLDAGLHIKGPDPYNDMARYGGYFNNSPAQTTASCTNASTSVTLAAALDFQDATRFPGTNIGNGIVLYQCGAATGLSTPPAPTVTPFGVTNGTTTYNYRFVAEDLQGGLTAASPAGTTTIGGASLGTNSVTLTQGVWSNTLNGEITYTCSSNCNLSVNAPINIAGFTGSARFNGNFTVISTPSSTTFVVYSPSSTVPSVTTDTSGGTMKVLACNVLTMASGVVPNSVEGSSSDTVMRWWVYRNNVLSFVVQARDPYYEDCGVNMPAGNIPSYVPSSPSASPVNKYLATTIVSGGGTTSIVVANAAGNTVSGQTALHDNSQNLLAATAASRFGTPVYIPLAGGNPPFNAATVFTSSNANQSHVLTAGLVINQPWVVRAGGLVFEGQRNSSTSFAFGNLAAITGGGSAYPVVLQLPLNNGSANFNNQQTLTGVDYVNLQFNAPALQQIAFVNDQAFMFGLLFDNAAFTSSTSSANVNIPAAVLKGPTHSVLGASGNENSCGVSQVILGPPCIRFTTQSGAISPGPVSVLAQSEINGWNMQGGASFQFDALPWSNSGGSLTSVPGVFNVRMIKFLGEQRYGPFIRVASPISVTLVLKQIDDDAPNAQLGNGFIDTAAMGLSPLNLVAEDIVSNVGVQVLVSGPAMVTARGVGLNVGTTMSGATSTPLSGVLTLTGGSIATSGSGTGIQAAGISSLGYAMPQPNAPMVIVGAHNSCASNCVAAGTYFYAIVANDIVGHNSIASPAISATTDGTQTITVSWVPVGGQVTTSRARGLSATNLAMTDGVGTGIPGTSYVDSGSTFYSVSVPQTSSANSSSFNSGGLATTQITVTNNTFADTISGTLSANRAQTIPDVTGYIPVSSYVNSAYDNATRANGAVGSNWNAQNGAINVSSNQFVGTGSSNNAAFWNVNSFAAPQFSQLTITAYNGTTDFYGPSVLMSGGGAGAKSYNCLADTTTIFLQRTSGTTNTNLTNTAITGNPGDVVRLETDGAGNLTCYLNGVSKLTANDTTYTSGSPGRLLSGSVATAKNWSGGNLHPLAHLDSEQDWTKTQHFPGNGGTCTMSAGTTCTITLPEQPAAPSRCIVAVQGSSAIAGACSISGTTLTITAASSNSATWAAWIF